MKLIEKLNQFRRDFDGVFTCQGCGNSEQVDGCYDDDYYHNNVIPDMKCSKCGESTKSLKLPNERMGTKYPAHHIV